jgi:Diadenosine tetraphosphate (Ap4A) hydrolase and other HIT family hydrolases
VTLNLTAFFFLKKQIQFNNKLKQIFTRKMEKSLDCLYCQRNDLQESIMIEMCDLSVSTLFLFKEQSHPGRCIVAYKDHVKELFELSETERNAFIADVCQAAAAIQKAFSPEKMNYGAYSDKLPHLHMHLVPKYEDEFEFGGIFEMNPQKVYLTDDEYNTVIEKIVKAL